MIRAGFGDMMPPAKQNIGSNSTDVIMGKEYWTQLLMNPEFQNRIKQIYRNDYQLIESVPFYRAEHIIEKAWQKI